MSSDLIMNLLWKEKPSIFGKNLEEWKWKKQTSNNLPRPPPKIKPFYAAKCGVY